jgi:hypothetical protein
LEFKQVAVWLPLFLFPTYKVAAALASVYIFFVASHFFWHLPQVRSPWLSLSLTHSAVAALSPNNLSSLSGGNLSLSRIARLIFARIAGCVRNVIRDACEKRAWPLGEG